MRIEVRLFWHDYRYFPYERVFARREAERALGCATSEFSDGLRARVGRVPWSRLQRLTYFKAIETSRRRLVPTQTLLEAGARRSVAGANGTTRIGRQSTRYSAHGLHEYRGKFNPQVVRAIGNILGIRPGQWVLDPFCGSGTTLLEAAHLGWNAVGLDMNPLGVAIANAKLGALRMGPIELRETADRLAKRLEGLLFPPTRKQLPNSEYLQRWFDPEVLQHLAQIVAAIEASPPRLRGLLRIALSDICREISHQDPGDLRIRRRTDGVDADSVIPTFVRSLRTKVEAIARARDVLDRIEGTQRAIIGDSRRRAGGLSRAISRCPERMFDAVITSPPYATALPYIDTQRLSLCLLGLVDSRGLRELEAEVIGTREISNKRRTQLEAEILQQSNALPSAVQRFCVHLLQSINIETDGFRRLNVPALVYQYMRDMSSVLREVWRSIKPGAPFAMVVGPNRTALGGADIQIETPRLVAEIAAHCRWIVEETVPLDAYQRFDIHARNSIRVESLLILRRSN